MGLYEQQNSEPEAESQQRTQTTGDGYAGDGYREPVNISDADSDLFESLQNLDLQDGVIDEIESDVRSKINSPSDVDREYAHDLLDWFQMADSAIEGADRIAEHYFGDAPDPDGRKNGAVLLGRIAQRRFPRELVENKLEFAFVVWALSRYGPMALDATTNKTKHKEGTE